MDGADVSFNLVSTIKPVQGRAPGPNNYLGECLEGWAGRSLLSLDGKERTKKQIKRVCVYTRDYY